VTSVFIAPTAETQGEPADASASAAAQVDSDCKASADKADFLAGYTGHTKAAYANDVRTWFEFCAERGIAPFSASRLDVASYLESQRILGRSAATVARRLATLRGFYALAVDEYGLTRSPANRIRSTAPKDVTRKRALTAGQLAAFLETADRTNPRTAGLAWLLATTGLRISEACGADSTDISTQADQHWLDVSTKGGLRRSVPLHPETWTRLAQLPGVLRTPEAARGSRTATPLFATRTGQPVDRNAAARTLIRVAKQAGIAETFSPHILRHTFVTTGHANPATTRGYDHTALGHHNHPGTRIVAGLGLLTDRLVASAAGETNG
jgi:integrase/recombinase XerD